MTFKECETLWMESEAALSVKKVITLSATSLGFNKTEHPVGFVFIAPFEDKEMVADLLVQKSTFYSKHEDVLIESGLMGKDLDTIVASFYNGDPNQARLLIKLTDFLNDVPIHL